MNDPTEEARRDRLTESNTEPGVREALEAKYGKVWTAEEVNRDFVVTAIIAPLVVVRRKTDNAVGSLNSSTSSTSTGSRRSRSITSENWSHAMTGNATVTGTIIAIRDCGTLVLVFVDGEEGRTAPIPMEHRAFRHMLEGEACESHELIGRMVSFDGDLVEFLD
jgi:hypothetical protein